MTQAEPTAADSWVQEAPLQIGSQISSSPAGVHRSAQVGRNELPRRPVGAPSTQPSLGEEEDRVTLSVAGRAAAAEAARPGVIDPAGEAPTESSLGEEKTDEAAESTKAAGDTSTEGTEETDQGGEPLDEEALREVEQMRRRDKEVRVHEQAHKAVGGELAGAIHLDLKTGPDGNRYAVSGHVSIDLSEVAGDPSKTVRKMERVQRAALAPADPSSADRQAAADAAKKAQAARQALATEALREDPDETKKAAKADEKSVQPNRGQRALSDAEIAAPRPTATQEQLTQKTQLSYQT